MGRKITDYTPVSQSFIDTDLLDISKHVTQTSGALIIGKEYTILDFNMGDNFTNVAQVVSGVINTTGCVFIATGTTPTTYSNGSTLAYYMTQSGTWNQIYNAIKPYKNLVFNMRQTGTSDPIYVDGAGADNPLENTLGEVPKWGRTSAGIYTLTVVAPLFNKSKLHLNGCVSVGTTGILAATIIDAGGVGGYVYFARASDYVINIYSVTETFVPADLSSILTNDLLCFPEIRIYP